MNHKHPSPGLQNQPAETDPPVRGWFVAVLAIVGVGAVFLMILASKPARSADQGELAAAANDQRPKLASPSHTGVAQSASPSLPNAALVAPVAPNSVRPEMLSTASRLIKTLGEIDTRPGQLTLEIVGQWKRDLQALADLETDALPAIRERLARQDNPKFDLSVDGNLLGEPSLRIALLKLLADIPGPESMELQAQVLRTTPYPEEIALVARQLELQEPGEYRTLIEQRDRFFYQRENR